MIDVLVVTTGHDPEDGRLIRHLRILDRAGFTTELIARPRRSRLGRFTLGPVWAVRAVRRLRPAVVILPDPELQLLVTPVVRRRVAVVCDVHEDYSAVLADRGWVRPGVRAMLGVVLRLLDRSRRRSALTLTVDERILPAATLVTNRPALEDLPAPIAGPARRALVYVGDVRPTRGMYSMLDLLDRIPSIELDIVGPCADERALSAEIAGRGLAHRVRLHGRLSYSRSWEIAREALAGLSLLHDTPAFRTARPTKIFEYGAVGIPVLATPLPGQAQLLADSSGGVVGNIDALASAVEDWVLDPSRARLIGRKGRSAAEIFDDGSSQRLVDAIAQLIDPGSRPDMS